MSNTNECPNCEVLRKKIEEKVVDLKSHQSFQEDIEIRKIVTCFITHSGYCKSCNKRVRSKHPEQTSNSTGSAGVFLGHTVKSLAVQFKHQLGVPFMKNLVSNLVFHHPAYSLV